MTSKAWFVMAAVGVTKVVFFFGVAVANQNWEAIAFVGAFSIGCAAFAAAFAWDARRSF